MTCTEWHYGTNGWLRHDCTDELLDEYEAEQREEDLINALMKYDQTAAHIISNAVFDIVPDTDLARAFLEDTTEVFQMFGFDVDLLQFIDEEGEEYEYVDGEVNVWAACEDQPDYVDFCYQYTSLVGNCLIAASYDGQTVIDTCCAFEDYRWDDMDFQWYGSDDACFEDYDQGDCLADIIDFVDADACYFQSRYNMCDEIDQCLAVVEIDGEYIPGRCEELADMFGIPYGDDDDQCTECEQCETDYEEEE